jgi:hypothetical protein
VSLGSGWTQVQAVRAWKHADGVTVTLAGVITHAGVSGGGAGVAVLTVPAGHRPPIDRANAGFGISGGLHRLVQASVRASDGVLMAYWDGGQTLTYLFVNITYRTDV